MELRKWNLQLFADDKGDGTEKVMARKRIKASITKNGLALMIFKRF